MQNEYETIRDMATRKEETMRQERYLLSDEQRDKLVVDL